MHGYDYTSSSDFLKRLFGETLHKVELRACSNDRSKAAVSVFTREQADIETFVSRQDKAGQGVYFGVCTRGDLTDDRGRVLGNKANARECPALWVDIDCLKNGIAGEEAITALNFLPFPPTIIVNSGGGLHAYWVLEEAFDLSTGFDAVEQALRALAHVLAGDTTVAEVARIMRLPGSHNTKPETLLVNEGAPALVEVLEDTGRVYDFDALVEWLSEQRAVLHGRILQPVKPVRADDPFLIYAKEAGYEPAIDIDAELDAMASGSIHQTQLRVSASMIARGYDEDEIVARILRATEAAAPRDQHWNWTREERAIRDMVRGARAKGYAERAKPSAPRVEGNHAVVHDLEEERERRAEPKKKVKIEEGGRSQTVAVGTAVIGVWNERYGPVMHTGGTTYCYDSGIWEPWNDALAQRLRSLIQEACASLRFEPKTNLLNAAKAYFMDRPELFRDDVEFDTHGMLIAEDAVLDFSSLEIREHAPEHYALFKVAANVRGAKSCPTWLDFLQGAFSDRSCAVEIIRTLQEWFGASIAATRSRPMLKGMLAHGASRTGKTQVSEVMRGILGERHICNARMRDLEGRFGLEPLIGKRGWIADDAIGAKEYLDAETYKVVVTGEKTSAQMKGGKNIEVRFGFPVMLTANNLPRVNDKSDATYNRSLILPMTVVRPENAPEPPGYDSVARKIIAEELTGVLWWAIEGRKRLFARGHFDPPAVMLEAGRSFQDSNDPIGSWIRQCVEPCRNTKIARKDLATSFHGWWQLESDDGKPFSANSITRAVQERFPALAEIKTQGERFFGGIRLNDEGLFAWETRTKAFDSGGKAFSVTRDDVNRYWSAEDGSAPEQEKSLAKTRF